MQVAVLRLLGSLFQVLDPIYDKLCVLNLNLQKGNCYNNTWLHHYCQQDGQLR